MLGQNRISWIRCCWNGTRLAQAIALALSLLVCHWGHAAKLDCDVIFVCREPGRGSHWYENFGYQAFNEKDTLYGARGRLCRLTPSTGRVHTILDDPGGTIRDPQVHYDAKKVLFSYRPDGSDYFHLYEIDVDGSHLRQLTEGPFDDLEPTYLPSGKIMFCSSRCRRWVNCWYSPVATLHGCDADGGNIRPISANIEHDNTPWPMPDGRVIYERWEYVDRSRVSFHHLWTANPDGSDQAIFYGNMHPGTLMIDAKPIPHTEGEVVAVFSPKHGRKEHAGAVAIVTPASGPDDQSSARQISQGADFRDPYPVAADTFLVAQGSRLLLMDDHGRTREIYRLPDELAHATVECHEPRPLRSRKREPVRTGRVDVTQATGKLFLADVYQGRQMDGVERGDITRLLVLETLPKPVNFSGKMPPISFGGTYTLERVLGTVPVEQDGSAFMELPAMRPLFFVALDKDNNSVKRMHSFLTVMPGETTSCVGCHEPRNRTPALPETRSAMALTREASTIEPIVGIPDVLDFPRDIQPILDRHCVRCHNCRRREGRVVLTGDHGPIYSHSYYTLTALQFVSDGRDRLVTNLPPRSVGSSASPLMSMLDGAHYGAQLSELERDTIRYWIESAASYPGTYAALGTGMIGGFPRSKLDTTDRKWPSSVAAAEAIERRCSACHDRRTRPLPKYLSDNLGLVLSNPDMNDVRIRYSRHLMFNLSRPEESLILLAPLAKSEGGYGVCSPISESSAAQDKLDLGRSDRTAEAVFATKDDPDYQRILAMCEMGREHLESIKRFDMPGFQPRMEYVREMRRFGVLPPGPVGDASLSVYEIDQSYWRSHWWQPRAN